MLQRLFLAHPATVGESYWQHQRVALSFALPLFAAAFAALTHALVPGLFVQSASRRIFALHARLEKRC